MRATIKKARSSQGLMSYESGLAAEDSISGDYERRGLSVACRRWRGSAGEIDIVARDGKDIVFIEVKKSRSFERALSSLSHQQVSRLFAAAEEFVANEPLGSLTDVRFDVALVNDRGEYRIIENAFA